MVITSSGQDVAELAHHLMWLRHLSPEHLQMVLANSQLRAVPRGQSLFLPADFARDYIFLLSGEASVSARSGVQEIEAGCSFPVGFMQAGTVSALALTDCLCLFVNRETLDRQLCWQQVIDYLQQDFLYAHTGDDEAAWKLTLLKSNLFQKVPPINVEQIFSKLKPQHVDIGTVIIKQGDVGDGCYFIRRGTAAVTRKNQGEDKEVHLADIGFGRCFGEDALINETVRNATIIMTSDGVLMRMEKSDFLLLLREPQVSLVQAAELDTALAAGARLLDVRTLDEYSAGHMAAAMCAPIGILRLKLRVLDPQADYIAYCDTGRRSRAAAHLLAQKGIKVRALQNGLASLDNDQRARYFQ